MATEPLDTMEATRDPSAPAIGLCAPPRQVVIGPSQVRPPSQRGVAPKLAETVQPRCTASGFELASRLDAIASLERALRLDPQHWRAATNLASCLLQCERFDDAVAPAQLAARQQPTLIAAHLVLAKALQAAGKPRAALPAAREAVRLHRAGAAQPEGAASGENPLLALGDLLVDLSELKEAWGYALEVAEISGQAGPQMASACTLAGRVQQCAGQHEQALAAFEKAAKLDPSKPRASQLRLAMITTALAAESARRTAAEPPPRPSSPPPSPPPRRRLRRRRAVAASTATAPPIAPPAAPPPRRPTTTPTTVTPSAQPTAPLAAPPPSPRPPPPSASPPPPPHRRHLHHQPPPPATAPTLPHAATSPIDRGADGTADRAASRAAATSQRAAGFPLLPPLPLPSSLLHSSPPDSPCTVKAETGGAVGRWGGNGTDGGGGDGRRGCGEGGHAAI